MTCVVIVGGGASGTLVAANLLAHARNTDDVVVVEPRTSLGQGVAYSTTHPEHLLNVRAKQMSAVVGDADHFQHSAGCDRDDFAPRAAYARYLAELLESRLSASPGRLRHVIDSVAHIERDGERWSLRCAGGETLGADVVVIATGNPAPSIPQWASGAIGAPGFIPDPWARGALDNVSGTVVAIGTGLTFVDVAVSVLSSSPSTRIIGISRHGLLPTPHTHVEHPPPLPELHTPREVLHWLRGQRAHWREAVNGLRSITQQLWISWSDDERRRFLRHAHRYWEVHRHRIAEPVAATIESHLATGRLEVRTMHVEELRVTTDGFDVRDARGSLRADHVVVCTGPSERAMLEADPIRELIADSYLRPGPLNIGIDCDPLTGAVIDADGTASASMFVMGPLRRGVAWETTAIPEIHVQADTLARVIVSR